jgi:hypothetical protein
LIFRFHFSWYFHFHDFFATLQRYWLLH